MMRGLSELLGEGEPERKPKIVSNEFWRRK